MTQLDSGDPPAVPVPRLPPLLLLFAGSGCAALIYEIVWLQMLQLMLGSTAVSLGVLLATFMGGMCLGSLLLPRVVSARRHPLRVYALLELGIGAIGLGVLLGMPALDHFYALHAVGGLPGVLLRGAVAGLCLLPPTMLMGATLPAVARWVEATPRGVSWLGFFYGSNIAGAVLGCLLAGFYLLRVLDMPTATCIAGGLNVAVAVVALVLAGKTEYEAPAPGSTKEAAPPTPGAWTVYLVIALSGMAALGGEVVWTRLLALLLGGTVYTFSLILAVFLIGLGAGSAAGARLARSVGSARRALGVCQLLVAVGVGWTAYAISGSLPYWPVVPYYSQGPWYTFQVDLVRCLWAVLPPACLWGASFPLALAAVAGPGRDSGRVVGAVYAANTAGAIAGALVFGLLLIPTIGTAGAERVLIGLAVAAGLLALAPRLRELDTRHGAALAVVLLVAAGLAWSIRPLPWGVVAYGRHVAWYAAEVAPGIVSETEVPTTPGRPDTYCTYVGEGMNVSVAVTLSRHGVRAFHGAGKVQASNWPPDMRLQRMLGHLPALVHKKPESVLVVACGAGVTAGCFVLHPDVKRIVICDIEPLVPTRVTPMFGKENYHIVDGIAQQNPHEVNGKQVEVVYDDGRHFLHTTQEKFDVITSDPIDPWVKGCAALNTVEYYQACKEHLNPGGSVSLWIPLYESNLDTTKSVIATFFQVFPDAILWSNEKEGGGYDAVLFGQAEPAVIDLDELQQRLDRPDHEPVRQSLHDVEFGALRTMPSGELVMREAPVDLFATYAGQASDLRGWSRGAQINTDRNLRLQYLAGMSLNYSQGSEILQSILAHYRFPDRLFVGSPKRLRALQDALDKAGRKEPGRGAAD
jgi:spermidine synthase